MRVWVGVGVGRMGRGRVGVVIGRMGRGRVGVWDDKESFEGRIREDLRGFDGSLNWIKRRLWFKTYL